LRVPKAKRCGVFKDYKPGFIHIDHFYLPALGGQKRYCFVAIDRATRLAFLKVYDRKTKQAAVDFVLQALKAFPFAVHHLMSDNGPEFTNRRYNRTPTGAKRTHPLDTLCARQGISRRFSKPYVPATNGMAERFVGLCKRATVSAKKYPSHHHIEQDLGRWLEFYNRARPHGGIGRATPNHKTRQWYKLDPSLFLRMPDPQCVPNLLGHDS
jgi:transposase InsO family protein